MLKMCPSGYFWQTQDIEKRIALALRKELRLGMQMTGTQLGILHSEKIYGWTVKINSSTIKWIEIEICL